MSSTQEKPLYNIAKDDVPEIPPGTELSATALFTLSESDGRIDVESFSAECWSCLNALGDSMQSRAAEPAGEPSASTTGRRPVSEPHPAAAGAQ